MATRKNPGIFGDYRGSVDTIVLSKWNDTYVTKSKPGPRRKKTTAVGLLRQNNVFGMVSSFFKSAKGLIKIAYQRPKVVKMTPYNAAVSYHLKNAITGDPDDPSIDLRLIKFSFPIRRTQSAWNPVLVLEQGYNVTVSWETNPFPQKCTQLDDKVILIFYDANRGSFTGISDVIDRSDLSFTEEFSDGFAEHELYWYMLLISADGKLISETEYLGMVTLPAKE